MATEKSLSTIEKVIFLKSVEIFEHSAIEELGRIAALTEEIRFEPGETIYQEGNPVDAIYVILQGRAAVLSEGKIVQEVGEKHPVGVLAALGMNSAPRTVKALQPIHALKINVQDFQDLLSSDFELVKAAFRVLSEQIRKGL